MLKIKQEEADVLNSNFSFKVTEILKFEKAELNEIVVFNIRHSTPESCTTVLIDANVFSVKANEGKLRAA